MRIIREASIVLVRSLVKELESKLMSIAGYTDKISTNRTLCGQCENFQSQDASTMFDPFLHSQDFSALQLSATSGCHLCELLADRQGNINHKGRQIDRSLVKAYEHSQVILQIVRSESPRLWISCNGSATFISLEHLDSTYSCLSLAP